VAQQKRKRKDFERDGSIGMDVDDDDSKLPFFPRTLIRFRKWRYE
jgi:hypothetical protein